MPIELNLPEKRKDLILNQILVVTILVLALIGIIINITQ
jgi:hypothetical protein